MEDGVDSNILYQIDTEIINIKNWLIYRDEGDLLFI